MPPLKLFINSDVVYINDPSNAKNTYDRKKNQLKEEV
jgi:hypothetical protein